MADVITVTDLKAKYLNINGSEKDAALTEFSELAKGWLRELCRQPISQEAITIYYEGARGSTIELPYTVPVTLATVKGRDDVADSFTAYTGTPVVYQVDGKSRIYLAEGMNSAFTELVINVGYDTGAAPNTIKKVFYQMVYELLQNSGYAQQGNRAGVKQSAENIGGMSTTTVYESKVYEWRRALIPYTIGL